MLCAMTPVDSPCSALGNQKDAFATLCAVKCESRPGPAG